MNLEWQGIPTPGTRAFLVPRVTRVEWRNGHHQFTRTHFADIQSLATVSVLLVTVSVLRCHWSGSHFTVYLRVCSRDTRATRGVRALGQPLGFCLCVDSGPPCFLR